MSPGRRYRAGFKPVSRRSPRLCGRRLPHRYGSVTRHRSARVRVPPLTSTTKEPAFPPASSPTPKALQAIAPAWPRNEAYPGSTSQNDLRTPKAVRRIPSGSGSLSESESNNAATRCRYRFRPRHRRHGTRARRSASQPLGLTHALTAPSRIAPVLPTRCFGASSHAASGHAPILFIPPILSAAAGHRDGMPRPGPVDSLRSQSRR